jgi:hypothetical protein
VTVAWQKRSVEQHPHATVTPNVVLEVAFDSNPGQQTRLAGAARDLIESNYTVLISFGLCLLRFT